jgi:hypothetical protein
MNKYSIKTLKILRKTYAKSFAVKHATSVCEQDPDKVAQLISDALLSKESCMIARFGANELAIVVNYLGVNAKTKSFSRYIMGKSQPWWWEKNILDQLHTCAGFFPSIHEKVTEFSQMMLSDARQIDVLGSWLKHEVLIERELEEAVKVDLELLNPYFSHVPWTRVLEGKTVLVVHPFEETIKRQYSKREKLFKNNLLPEFNLKTVKAVQSIAGNSTQFKDWFEALQYMKDQIEKVEFDICLIGAGAYGLPLAAHVKRMGKKSVHLGGSLQLLFGGKRWENPNYNPTYNYASLMNEHWTRPCIEETPTQAAKVEAACYW